MIERDDKGKMCRALANIKPYREKLWWRLLRYFKAMFIQKREGGFISKFWMLLLGWSSRSTWHMMSLDMMSFYTTDFIFTVFIFWWRQTGNKGEWQKKVRKWTAAGHDIHVFVPATRQFGVQTGVVWEGVRALPLDRLQKSCSKTEIRGEKKSKKNFSD